MKIKKIIANLLTTTLFVSMGLVINSDKSYAITQVYNFSYTGKVQTFTAPYAGTYELEVWGAQGGSKNNNGGKGGYAEGEIKLTQGQTISVYVGASPNSGTIWNGGGHSNYSGGDATDIRTGGSSLSNRVIVAGGGGGTGLGPNSTYNYVGGVGGGLTGGNGNGPSYYVGHGGTQTSGGSRGTSVENNWYNQSGSFGQGGNSSANTCGGAGGGGWYGGGAGECGEYQDAGGGGGSSYIGGVSKGSTIAGNASMPSTSGSTETGHSGNGYAKITMVTVPNILDGQTTTVIGTFEATTIDVSIPAVNSFLFNSDTNKFDIQNIKINNNSSAPVYANLKEINISSDSDWKPTLIAPTTYTDTGWNNLNQTDTKNKIALGVSAIDGSNWLGNISNKNIWSTDTSNKSELGIIQTDSSIEVAPTMKSGTAVTNEKVLTANYVFEFGLK